MQIDWLLLVHYHGFNWWESISLFVRNSLGTNKRFPIIGFVSFLSWVWSDPFEFLLFYYDIYFEMALFGVVETEMVT